MILSTHYAVGMAVAHETDSLLLMPLLALLSHFLLDKIPHWEYLKNTNEMKKKPLLIFFDLFFVFAISVFFFFNGKIDFEEFSWLNLGGFFGILPDGLVVLNIIFWRKNKLLKKFFKFHEKNHNKKDLTPFWGIISQSAIILVCLGMVFL